MVVSVAPAAREVKRAREREGSRESGGARERERAVCRWGCAKTVPVPESHPDS